MKNLINQFCNAAIVCCFLCAAFGADAQIVNILDANFKAALVSTLCVDTNNDGIGDIDADQNNDGRIQTNEALAVTALYVSNKNINDLTGIQSFTNLKSFDCRYNQLTSLDVQGLLTLQYLYCNFNQLTVLNVQGLTNLLKLYCNNNQLVNLNVQAFSNLTYLDCHVNQLTNLNVQGTTSLQYLNCSNNQLVSLNLQNSRNLGSLYCNNNQLSNINVQGVNSLTSFTCATNQLTSLNIQSLGSLVYFDCYNNHLTYLDIQNLASLETLYCNKNPINCLSSLPNVLQDLDIDSTNVNCLLNLPSGLMTGSGVALPVCQAGDVNGCFVATINEVAAINSAVKIMPNPMHDATTFELTDAPALGSANTATLVVYNALGQAVRTVSFEGNKCTFTRDALPAGCYFYSIQSGAEVLNKGKLVIE